MIAREIAAAIDEDQVGAVVLGCAGMAGFADSMTRQFGLPVIDGVVAAIVLAEALHHAHISCGSDDATAGTKVSTG